jgi:hypothetical protein
MKRENRVEGMIHLRGSLGVVGASKYREDLGC